MSAPDQTGSEASGTQPLVTRKAPRLGKSFSSRNPTPIGAIGLVLLLALLYAAFNAANLPLIGGGTEYHAMFDTSANLKADDDVRVAGVKVGKVTDVSIDTKSAQVKVTFTVKDGWIGDQSTAYIKLKTLLGAKYLEIDSEGAHELSEGSTIPRIGKNGEQRTFSPFDVYPAFTKLTKTIDNLNTADVTQALNTLSQAFSGTPSDVGPVVRGLSRLSTTIASRDQQLRDLLAHANSVTGVLAARDQDLQRILSDGTLLLNELNARRDAIHQLLINTQVLSEQLRGLVADNEKTLGPLFDNLNKLLGLLQANQDSLDRGLSLLGPFYRVFTNVIGNGRWFDNYVQNLSVTGLVATSPAGGR